MASFTDELIQFNPYISQIPESYHTVGMIKQQQYDQGVAQVQSYISSVAGLEVMKGEHKDYLESRVNELTTQLNKVAPLTEFGDQSFINQVGGYASRIASDPIIQNAVAATATHKKNMQYIDEERKKGVDTTRNEWDYNKQLNSWLNDGDIKSSFNGRYSPVVDVMGEFYKAFKEAHPNSDITQDAFRVGSDGKIELNEAMEELTREGISPQKVKSIADMVFSRADVSNQVRIDGQYAYRGFDQAALAESVRRNYQAVIDDTNRDIQEMKSLMTTDSSVDKVALSRKIQERRDAGAKLIDEYKQYTGLIATNPESAKVALYQNNLTANLMNSFTWEKKAQKIVDNPLFKAKMDLLNYNLNVSKFEHDEDTDAAKLEIDRAKLDLDRQRLEFDKQQGGKKKKGDGTDDEDTGVKTTTGNIPDMQGKLGVSTFDEALNNTKAKYANTSAKYVSMLANDEGVPEPKHKLPDGTYVWNIGPGGYTDQAAAEAAWNRIFSNAQKAYQSGTPTASVTAMMTDLDPISRSMNAMLMTKDRIDPKYDQMIKELENKYKQSSSSFNPLKSPVTLLKKNGSNVTMTPQDFTEAMLGISRKFKIVGQGGDAQFYHISDKVTSTGAKILEEIDLRNTPRVGGFMRELYFRSRGDFDNSKSGFQQEYSAILSKKEQEYKEAQLAFEPQRSTFLTPDNKTTRVINQQFVDALSGLKEGNNSSEVNSLLAWTIDGKNPDEKVDQNTYGVYYDRFADKSYMYITRGKETRRVEVPRNVAESMPGIKLSDEFWDAHGAELGVSGRKTTDIPIAGHKQGESSAYSVPKLPGGQYNVKYHLVGDGDGKYSMKLYVRDPQGKLILDGVSYNPPNLTSLMTPDQVMTARQTLQNDLVIQGLINRNSGAAPVNTNNNKRYVPAVNSVE